MIVKLLTEHHLEFLSLKGGCRGSSESTIVKMSNCWKSHALAHFILQLISFLVKIWHVISHVVTPPLVLMTAWSLFGIVEYRTFRSSVFI